MADKSIDQLNAAEKVYATDLFVLQQSGTAKKLTGQVLENWLVSFADGHGGIHSIEKLSTSGLVDTYRITLADTATFDFVVTNGRSVNSIDKTSTSGLVDTYTITYNNGTTSKFTVTNGAKGDKGDNAYVWIKYASQEPTDSSHSMGDIPDDWIGIYSGNASSAPTDWKQYQWFNVKGEKGDTGDAATLLSKSVTYQVGDSGSIIPSGAWVSSVPVVSQGKYLWTKTEIQFNSGDPIISYSVARMGMDGTGSVSSVAGVSPDETGNVPLTAADVGALAVSGGDMEGAINMNGQPISGLNDPTEDTQAARKGYVDASVRKAAPRNLLDNSDFRNPVNQRGAASVESNYGIDRWYGTYMVNSGCIEIREDVFQYIPYESVIDGRKYTSAVCFEDGSIYLYSGTLVKSKTDWQINKWFGNFFMGVMYFPDKKAYQFYLKAGNNVKFRVVWAALYEGEYTAATLPEYQPKGYWAELAECKRYCVAFNYDGENFVSGYGYIRDNTTALLFIPLQNPIRKIPSISNTSGNKWALVCNGSQYIPDNISVWFASSTVLGILATGNFSGNSMQVCNIYINSSEYIVFSADL